MEAFEKQEFTETILRLYERYKRPSPSAGLVVEWFDDFADWTLEQFNWALSKHRKISSFMPEPKNLYDIRGQAEGVLSPDEAWGLALSSRDESLTVIVSGEILEALGAAIEILESGSPSMAAQAFKSAYSRIIASRPHGKQKWIVSLGHNIEGRDDVVRDAVNRRLISHRQGQALLLKQPDDIYGLLENKAEQNNGLQRDKVKALQKIIKESSGHSEQVRQERKAAAQKKLDEFEAARREAVGSIKQLTSQQE